MAPHKGRGENGPPASQAQRTPDLTLQKFCSDWAPVFADPTVMQGPAALMPTATRSAANRYYPQRVVEWSDFEERIDDAFRRLGSRIRARNGGRGAVFPPGIEWRRLGERFMHSTLLWNEADVTRYESRAVEEPVSLVFHCLGQDVQYRLQSEPPKLPGDDIGKRGKTRKPKPPRAGASLPVSIENQTPERPPSSENVAAGENRRVMDALVIIKGEAVAVGKKKPRTSLRGHCCS
jgi:hypothetical protein